jgi:haloalkane dehalogenase
MSNNSWIDKNEYPFQSRFFDTPAGQMHYVDEGKSDHVIVMVHGNPIWSFAYRHLIKGLSDTFRCIAVDHIGFGLSDKPENWDYQAESHAENLKNLLDSLNIQTLTLVVEDWGGPIGLSYALNYPDKVKSLVIMNTWCWSVKYDPHFEKFSSFMGGALGRFLVKRFNFFARVVLKQAFGDKSKLTKPIHRHYLNALQEPQKRKGCYSFPKSIIGESAWLDILWQQKEKIVNKPAIVFWGKKDIAFRDKELGIWKESLTNAEFYEFDNVGHFPQEEIGVELCPIINEHVNKHSP